MPIYEYRCAACNRRTSVFVRSISAPVRASCEHCGSARLTRLMSRFAVHRGGGGDPFDDPDGFDDVDEDDPQSVARWARRMREESGEDLGPEFDEMVNRMEAGESPEDVFGDEVDGEAGGDDDELP
ncbi:MAG: FmdB family zinc ribbon protein [Dehalococcoidia bacterium]